MAARSSRSPVEQWFLRRGIPHFIEGYSAREDILTRAAPFLSVVFVAEVLVTFGDRFRGLTQAAAFAGSLAVLFTAVVIVNRVRGRAPLARPDDIGPPEVVAFLVAPTIVALLFGNDPWREALALFGANVVVLAVVYVAASYGLVPMIGWGIRQLRRQLHDVLALIVKTLPFLLLFSAFLLLTTEVWQAADDMPGAYYAFVVASMALAGALFIGFATRTGLTELAHFDSWSDVAANCAGTPLEGFDPARYTGAPSPPALPRRAQFNVALVMFVSQAIQIVLVTVVAFAFYLGFGLLTIREATLTAWLGGASLSASDRITTFGFLGHDVVLTRQMLYVAGFIAAFAGLQFAVQIVSDASYRQEFAADMAHDVRQALAVRAAALAG